MNFADTNWLSALYIAPHPGKPEQARRHNTVARFMRQNGGVLLLSHIVLLEAENVFRRQTRQQSPEAMAELEADFDSKLFVDPLNWQLLRREAGELFSRYAWRETVGTLDDLIVASAKLAGARRFLSFDFGAKAWRWRPDWRYFRRLTPRARPCFPS